MNVILFFMNELNRTVLKGYDPSRSVSHLKHLVAATFKISTTHVCLLTETGISITESISAPLLTYLSEGQNSISMYVYLAKPYIQINRIFLRYNDKVPEKGTIHRPTVYNNSKANGSSFLGLEKDRSMMEKCAILLKKIVSNMPHYVNGLRALREAIKLSILLYSKNKTNISVQLHQANNLISKINSIPFNRESILDFFCRFDAPNTKMKLSEWFSKNVYNSSLQEIFSDFSCEEKEFNAINSEFNRIISYKEETEIDQNYLKLSQSVEKLIKGAESTLQNLNKCFSHSKSPNAINSNLEKINGRRYSLNIVNGADFDKHVFIKENAAYLEGKYSEICNNLLVSFESSSKWINDIFSISQEHRTYELKFESILKFMPDFLKKCEIMVQIISAPKVISCIDQELQSQDYFDKEFERSKSSAKRTFQTVHHRETERRELFNNFIKDHFCFKLFEDKFVSSTKTTSGLIKAQNNQSSLKRTDENCITDKNDSLIDKKNKNGYKDYLENNGFTHGCELSRITKSDDTERVCDKSSELKNKIVFLSELPSITREEPIPDKERSSDILLNTMKDPDNEKSEDSQFFSAYDNSDMLKNMESKESKLVNEQLGNLVEEITRTTILHQSQLHWSIMNENNGYLRMEELNKDIENLKVHINSISTKLKEKKIKNLLPNCENIGLGEKVLFIYDHRINKYFVPSNKTHSYFLSPDDPIYKLELSKREPFFTGTVDNVRVAKVALKDNRFNLDVGTEFYLIKRKIELN